MAVRLTILSFWYWHIWQCSQCLQDLHVVRNIADVCYKRIRMLIDTKLRAYLFEKLLLGPDRPNDLQK